MCNIGFRPTFNEKKFVMEVHILSNKFSDLYDKNFYIEFLLKIRDEIKFDNQEELVKQIKKDEDMCIKLIDSFNLIILDRIGNNKAANKYETMLDASKNR